MRIRDDLKGVDSLIERKQSIQLPESLLCESKFAVQPNLRRSTQRNIGEDDTRMVTVYIAFVGINTISFVFAVIQLLLKLNFPPKRHLLCFGTRLARMPGGIIIGKRLFGIYVMSGHLV